MAEFQMTSSGDGGEKPNFRDMFGPGQVDQMLGGALQQCWMVLPMEKKTVAGWEAEVRRIFERAVKNFKEDFEAFSGESKA